jgi:2-phosphosulfolactate phosphatase
LKKELCIDAVLTPADVQSADLNNICIVVDVLRASSTIVTLLSKGCRRVYTVETISDACSLAQSKGLLLVGERNGIKVDGFDYGNSPFELEGFEPDGREAVLTTTNGTKAVQKVSAAPEVLIGCFLNAKACCMMALELSHRHDTGINIICAGEKGRFVLDDAFCTGYLVAVLAEMADFNGTKVKLSDAAQAAGKLYRSYPDIRSGFLDSYSGQRLMEINSAEDLTACGKIDITEVVPVLYEKSPCLFIDSERRS